MKSKYFNSGFLLFLSLILASCSTHKMGLDKSTDHLSLNNEGLILLTLELSNSFKPDMSPEIGGLMVRAVNRPSKKKGLHIFRIDDEGTEKNAHHTLLSKTGQNGKSIG